MSIALLSLPVLFLLIIIEFFASRLLRISAYRLNDALSNLSNAILKRFSNVAFDALFLALYALIYHYFTIIRIPVNSPWSWCALFILLDVQYYWHHRFSHRVNFAWAAHSVHHQSEDFNLTVALRMSATQTLVHWSFNMAFAFMGFDPLMFLTVYSVSTVAMYWYHTRLIKRMGFLEHILMTPSHHRVHHGRDEKYIDKNYGGIFIFWDKMFGTFEQEAEEPRYGTLKPVRSWQPLKCQFSGFSDLIARSRALPRWRERILVWFVPPDHPLSLGGSDPFAAADQEKYDAKASPAFLAYGAFQFVLTAAIAIAIFVAVKHIPTSRLVMMGLYVLGSMSLVAYVVERGRFNMPLELLRLLATPLVVLLLPDQLVGDGLLAASLTTGLQVLALAAIVLDDRRRTRTSALPSQEPAVS